MHSNHPLPFRKGLPSGFGFQLSHGRWDSFDFVCLPSETLLLSLLAAIGISLLFVRPAESTCQLKVECESVRKATQDSNSADGEDTDGRTIREILFWTTRKLESMAEHSPQFTAELGPASAGQVQVSIPAGHKPGAYERPLLGRGDPKRHLFLADVSRVDRENWLREMETHLANAERKEFLILVHGFNMAFEEAAFRAAQWSFDSEFPGVIVMFTWPSQGAFDADSYYLDQENAIASVPGLVELLQTLAEHFPDTPRHALAHSVGSRMVMAAALRRKTVEVSQTHWFQKLILAAPDIDDQVFRRVGARALTEIAHETTVLCHPQDLALQLSMEQHGNRLRTGLVSDALESVDRLRWIDVSGTTSNTRMVGMNHLYFTDCPSVIREIGNLLEGIDTESYWNSN